MSKQNTDQHWVVDTARIRRELGYEEPVARDEALRRTIVWERAAPRETIDRKQGSVVKPSQLGVSLGDNDVTSVRREPIAQRCREVGVQQQAGGAPRSLLRSCGCTASRGAPLPWDARFRRWRRGRPSPPAPLPLLEPDRNVVYLFGGRTRGAASDELWLLDPAPGATWSRVETRGPVPESDAKSVDTAQVAA